MIIIFLLNFGSLPNFDKGEKQHFKFGTQTDIRKMIKYPHMGCGQGYVIIFLTFGTSSGAMHFLFGI